MERSVLDDDPDVRDPAGRGRGAGEAGAPPASGRTARSSADLAGDPSDLVGAARRGDPLALDALVRRLAVDLGPVCGAIALDDGDDARCRRRW